MFLIFRRSLPLQVNLKSSMNAIDIADVAKKSGVTASTLRYYEERGLIHSIGRRGLRRVFNANVLDRLALIALGQAAGFSLDEIAQMLTENDGRQIDRDQLLAKADELDETIRKLMVVSKGLRHAAACPAPSHWECSKFQRLLKVAVKGRTTKTSKLS